MVLDNAELYLLFLPLFENYLQAKKSKRCSNLCPIPYRAAKALSSSLTDAFSCFYKTLSDALAAGG